VKIQSVSTNNRRHRFEVHTHRGVYDLPYSRTSPSPTPTNKVVEVGPDPDLGNEAFTYRLASGDEGSVHLDSVLEFNEDPEYMADLTLYNLSVEAKRRLESSGLSMRQVADTLGTSPTQVYRLLDPDNRRKSMRQVVALFSVLGCDVEVHVRERSDGTTARTRQSKRSLSSSQ
jgi:hypothetical protein